MFEPAYQLERSKGFRETYGTRHHDVPTSNERFEYTISALVFLNRKLKNIAFEIRCTAASIQVPRIGCLHQNQSLSDMELNPNSGNSKLLVKVCFFNPIKCVTNWFYYIWDFLSIDASSRLGKPANFQPRSHRLIKRVLKPAVMSVSHKLTGNEWRDLEVNEYSNCWTEMYRSHKTIPTNKCANCVTLYRFKRSVKRNTKNYRFTDLTW